jgi:CubicO group peptidase (beta-lactamase class C family)
VSDHLDWFDIAQAHEGSGPITIESLLTHSSGLPRESDYPYWNGPDFPFPTRDQVIERLRSQQTLYPAQYHFQYSNLGLSLAGEIIQLRSGQPYDAYVREHILEPLGLDATRSYYPQELRGEELAIGYTGIHRDSRRDPVEPFFTRGITAAAGFHFLGRRSGPLRQLAVPAAGARRHGGPGRQHAARDAPGALGRSGLEDDLGHRVRGAPCG